MIAAGTRRRSATFETYRNPPLDSDEEFASAQIAEAVLYWPYVSKVHGIDIAISANEPNPKLVDWVLSLYDKAEMPNATESLQIKYVLLSGAEMALSPKIDGKYKLVFQNATHRIYAFESIVVQ